LCFTNEEDCYMEEDIYNNKNGALITFNIILL
jgi:hypothetical protein